MIPAYKDEVKLEKVLKSKEPVPIRDVMAMMEHQIVTLRESVDYLKRENSRLKADIQTLAQAINRK